MAGLRGTAIAAAVTFLAGLFISPLRAWAGYLTGFTLFACLALAGAFFLAVLTLVGARWVAPLRPIPEAMASRLPVAGLLGLVLLAGVRILYPWSDTAAVTDDPLLAGKAAYLNFPFFALRLVVFFVLWTWLGLGLARASRRWGEERSARHARASTTYACLFLPVFAVTFSLASVDWLQSLEPHWYSSIYALYTLAGLGSSGLALAILLTVYLRRGPWRTSVSERHLDDLGKIGIALALFWGYIWYCQYMLVWYTHLPEETPYYVLRQTGDWRVLSVLHLILNCAIPFLALLPRAARRSEALLSRVAGVMLVGQWLHLYLLVAPALMGERPLVGIWELAPGIGALALFLYLVLRGLARQPLYRSPE